MKRKIFLWGLFVLGLFLFFQLISILTLYAGNYFLESHATRKAQVLFTTSYWTSLTLNKVPLELVKDINKIKPEVEIKDPKIIHKIDSSEVSVSDKKITTQEYDAGHKTITLSAILKNNAKVGIPSIKLSNITMYNNDNVVIAKKQDYDKNIFMPYGTEYPFTFQIINPSEPLDVSDFSVEMSIPEFTINEKAVRLDTSNAKLLSVETFEAQSGKNYTFRYRFTIGNNTDREVNNIRRLTFLKHEGHTLTLMEDACCTQVAFVPPSTSNYPSLGNSGYVWSLKPQEQREFELQISPNPELYTTDINSQNIELINYIFGAYAD